MNSLYDNIHINPDIEEQRARKLYPNFWEETKDVYEYQDEGFLYKVKPNKNQEEYEEIEAMILSMSTLEGFTIKSIKRFQHHKKYKAYADELQTVKDNLKKEKKDLEPEMYLFNIYRYQTTKDILNGEGEVTFEYKLVADDDDDEKGIRNKEV